MLKLISLYTIDKIFEQEAIVKISPKSKVAYMQCLIKHFGELEPKLSSLQAFSFEKNIINQRSLPLFSELEMAGLVIIETDQITFVNHWHKYIDKTKLEKVKPHEYLGMVNYKKAEDYRETLLSHQGFSEIAQMQCKISAEKVIELINLFFKEQGAHEESYASYQAASRHCLSYIRKQYPTAHSYKSNSTFKTNATTQQFKPGKELGCF